MPRRILVLFAMVVGLVLNARATGLSCTLNGFAQSCYQQNQIFFDQTVNWLTGLGEAYGSIHSGAWATSNQAINVTLTSAGALQRSDNTGFAWDGAEWTLPDFAPGGTSNGQSISTYAGHFGAPNLPSLSAPFATPSVNLMGGAFGDDLVGVLGGAPLTINFATPVTSAGFMVSARNLASFTANLQAFDAQNNLLGTYAIIASGLGGACAGLGDFSVTGNPHPCTDSADPANYAPAAFIAFLGQNRNISKLVLQTNDNTGLFLDQMFLSDAFGQGVPEPTTLILLGSGLCLFAWMLRRRVAMRIP